MNSNCAKCQKTVYPTEKISALNNSYHKGCFKCQECNITLNLKTFQSFDGVLYCKVHTPKPQAKVIGETLEQQRLKTVSNLNSNIQYRADFEKSKGDQGSFASAALDAPEIRMGMKNSAQISQVKYQQGGNSHEPSSYVPPSTQPQQHSYTAAPAVQQPVQQQQQQIRQQPAAPPAASAAPVYRALYTYPAAADDELGIEIGDEIIDVQLVAEGWFYGTNKRTGLAGLLPEPYCQKI
eukprot:Partr_v1_DN24286_c0_g1_i1_m36912 putative LIM and SH3 protein 1